MEWLSDFLDWLVTDRGQESVRVGFLFLLALLIGAVLAGWVTRMGIRGLLRRYDRGLRDAAVLALIEAATEASVWNSLSPQEQMLANRTIGRADAQIRLLPLNGSDIAANWASHQLNEMKRNSATFGYLLDPVVLAFRERLLYWCDRPNKAKRIFEADLDAWQQASSESERKLLAEQEAWVAQQHQERYSDSAANTPIQRASAAPVPQVPQPVAAQPVAQPFAAQPAAAQAATPTQPFPPAPTPQFAPDQAPTVPFSTPSEQFFDDLGALNHNQR
ncbi:hypothetical protein [Homoserinimonas sp. OAct 916]|uniref:hypothetical protein n=1 Tax=Homoserinimonas sp. OAct 916 TaxID=2211450 RepID=UPI000DBE9455|nr:hypothetical protein [Homoserinimonas sp. OAct 916]